MAKKAKNVHGALIIGLDVDNWGAWNFLCAHTLPDGSGLEEIRAALTGAWKAWAKTEEGKQFIEHNGTNWGDCTDIPSHILRKFDILSFENVEILEDDGRASHIRIQFDSKHVVEHNETFAWEW